MIDANGKAVIVTVGLNCTFMELKLGDKGKFLPIPRYVLIVPLWN